MTLVSRRLNASVCASAADKPGAPRELQVTEQHKESIAFSWEAPESDGGAPITKYVVEKADAKRAVFAVIGETDATTRFYRATKLYEGSEYLFRVAAENAIGQGPPVTLAEPIIAKLAFGWST